MVTYEEIKSSTPSHITHQEIFGGKRGYSGLSIFIRHYYRVLRAQNSVECVILGIEDLLNLDSDDDSCVDMESRSIASLHQAENDMSLISNNPNIIRMWNSLSDKEQDLWRDRAERLNSHPVPGFFTEFPSCLLGSDNEISLSAILDCLSRDYIRFSKQFHRLDNQQIVSV